MDKMQVRNRMTATQLVISENPNTNNVFFMCGTKKGYVSPAVSKAQDTVTLEEMQYAECLKPGSDNWVPCLMMVGNSKANVKRTLGGNLLH